MLVVEKKLYFLIYLHIQNPKILFIRRCPLFEVKV